MARSEEHTSELQSPCNLVCRLLLEKKKKKKNNQTNIYHTQYELVLHNSGVARCYSRLFYRTGVSLLLLSVFFIIGFSFFFNDTATTEIYTLSLHDALPI